MSEIKVIAFDCDGVMFDTEAANRTYYNDILAHVGRSPMTDEQFAYCQMHTVDQALAYLFPERDEYERAQAFRRKNGYSPYIGYMKMAPDLVDVLSWCRPGFKTAVATNRSDTMDRVLEVHGLGKYFDLVVTALDVENPKPHPEQLIKISEHFGASPKQVLYIGDSSVDEQAARAAGVRLAACCNPSLDADYHIKRLAEIKAIAGGLNRRKSV
ncbi:MAG: HAD family hydrolase [Desulfobacteraceae bacterium]|nr:HAD family hydrolase [Desulfobacteraceae bacterium]